jgi:aminopeptidase N
MVLEHRHHSRCGCGSALSSYEAQLAPSSRPFALAGVKRVYERARPFSIRHIALDWDLQVADKAVAGTAMLSLERIDAQAREIVLDAVGFELFSVELRDDERAKFAAAQHVYDGKELRVTIDEAARAPTLRVRYRAIPQRGLYFLAPDEHVRDRPRQVWSQCQDEDARHIFPCHDKPHVKQSTELRVRVPAGWFALSNGELVSEPSATEKGNFHYRFDEPHPSYLFSLVAGEFSRIDDAVETATGTIPLAYYVPKGREDDGRRTFRRTPEMIRHFAEKTGVPYPWKRYGQAVVSDFIFGGMENTTVTTVYEHVLLDERASIDVSSDDLIAHELAHQWFGDLVTCRDWSHAWLNEGFATFMEQIDREHHLGRDEYDYGIRADACSYIGEAKSRYRRAIVCQDYEEPIDIFDRHLYEKGACVLHMLRRELSDDVFWRGVGVYLNRHARGIVETRDLHRALEEVSGKSLEQFFEQWVYRAGHPCLNVKIEHEGDLATVTVKQTEPSAGSSHSKDREPSEPPAFAFDLVLDFGLDGGRVERQVRRVELRSHTFVIAMKKRPRFVVVDPEQAVIGEIAVEAPADLLQHQLDEAPTARGRMLAAEGLGQLSDPTTLRLLESRLAQDNEFWGTRAEIAAALGKIRSEQAFEVLSKNLATKHPKVRRAVVHALANFRTPKAAEVLRSLALSDPSYLVEAEAARSLGSTRQPSAFETLLDTLDRPAWADVIRAGTLDGFAELRDDRAVAHVLARTRYGVSTRGRRAAIAALPKLSTDRKTREALEDLLDEKDPYLRVDVVRALSELGDAKSRGPLQRQLDRDLDGRVRRRIRETLRDLGGGAKQDADRLKDELEAVRAEQSELKARLAKLEASKTPASTNAAQPKSKRVAIPAQAAKPQGKKATRARSRR